MSVNMRPTDGTIRFDTSKNDSGGTLVPPTATTLGAAITVTTSPLAITLVSGTATLDGTYINIDTGGNLETVLIQSGGGTNTPTVLRAQLGTAAITHSNGVAVAIPGSRTLLLLPGSQAPNQRVRIQKVSPIPPAAQNSDINVVVVVAGGSNYFPGGGTQLLLIDNGVNSSTELVLPAVGNAIFVAGGVGSAAAGQVGPPGPAGSATPAAPNILSATVTVAYAPNGYGPQNVLVSGTMTLDSSNPNFSHEKVINVYGVSPAGVTTLVCSVAAAAFGGSSATYSGILEAQPGSTQAGWTLQFVCVNESGNPTSGPYTSGTFTVNAASLTSITFTEPGPRYANAEGSVHSQFSLVPLVANAQVPIWITARVDYDDGKGPQQLGQYYLTTVGQAITWDTFVPTNAGQTAWSAFACVGNIAQNAALPAGYVTASLTVAAVGAPLATDVTAAQFVPDANGHAVLYAVNGVGVQDWWYNEIDWTQPAQGYDLNYWFSMISVQKGYSSGSQSGTVSGGVNLAASSGPSFTSGQVGYIIRINGVENCIAAFVDATHVTLESAVSNGAATWEVWNPAPDKEGVDDYPGMHRAGAQGPLYHGRQIADSGELQGGNSTPGTIVKLKGEASEAWTLPANLLPGTSTANPYVTFRFWIYAGSRLMSNPLGGTLVLQTSAWSGVDHIDVTPTNVANPLDLMQANLNTASPQMGFNAGGQLGPLGIPVVLSLPTLPSSFYPTGAIVQLSTTGVFYQNVAGAWQTTQDPTKLISGALASGVSLTAGQVTAGSFVGGVIYGNSISATQINAGTLSVGGSAGMPGIINVYNPVGIVAEIGTITAGGGGPFYGVWTQNLWAGGGGPSSALVTLAGSSGAITACSLNAASTNGGITTTVAVNVGATPNPVQITNSLAIAETDLAAGHVSCKDTFGNLVIVGATQISLEDASNEECLLTPTQITIFDSGGNQAILAWTKLKITGLPSSNPGAGSKQFWYDPADSNRVKFAS